MGAPSLMTLISSARRLLTPGFRAPVVLWSAFSFSLFLFTVTHAVGLCDLWLHATTTTRLTNATLPLTDAPLYGIGFNESLCPGGPIRRNVTYSNNLPCSTAFGWTTHSPDGAGWALHGDAGDSNGFVILNGLLVSTNSSLLSNASSLPRVQTLAEAGNMAIAVPGKVNSSHSFDASSFGVRVSCAPILSGCTEHPYHANDIANCSQAGYPELPLLPQGLINGTYEWYTPNAPDLGIMVAQVGNNNMIGATESLPPVTDNDNIPYPNPVLFALQLVWDVYAFQALDFVAVSGGGAALRTSSVLGVFPGPGFEESYGLMATCNLSYYNVTIRQAGGYFTLLNANLSDPEFAAVLYFPLFWQMVTEHLESYMQSIALALPDEGLIPALEAELARQALSMAASMFEPTDPLQQTLIEPKLLGQYPLAPVLTMFVLIVSFTVLLFLLTIWILVTSSSPVILQTGSLRGEEKGATVIELTQLRLINPLALAAQLFWKVPDSSLKPDVMKMFEADNQDATVGIGLVEKEGRKWFQIYDLNEDLYKPMIKSVESTAEP